MKTIRTNQLNGLFAFFQQVDQLGIITEHSTQRKVQFWGDDFVAAAFVTS